MGTQASPASDYTARTLAEGTHCLVNALYKGESQGKKQPRRLEGAKTFAALSSPSHVERLWGVRSS